MKITYAAKYDLIKACVAKLWFGEKYLIVKWEDMQDNIQKFKRRIEQGIEWNEITEFIVRRFIRRVGEDGLKHCRVEILLSSNKGEELLAKEQYHLNLSRRDKNCLNANWEPRRPTWLYEMITDRPPAEGFFTVKGRHRAGPAVVKLWVGKKFFIWKCKDIKVFPEKFNTAIEANIKNYDPEKIDLITPLVEYIRDSAIEHGMIEVMYKVPEKHIGRLLYLEGALLKKMNGKSVCLNRNKKPYKPAWIKYAKTS